MGVKKIENPNQLKMPFKKKTYSLTTKEINKMALAIGQKPTIDKMTGEKYIKIDDFSIIFNDFTDKTVDIYKQNMYKLFIYGLTLLSELNPHKKTTAENVQYRVVMSKKKYCELCGISRNSLLNHLSESYDVLKRIDIKLANHKNNMSTFVGNKIIDQNNVELRFDPEFVIYLANEQYRYIHNEIWKVDTKKNPHSLNVYSYLLSLKSVKRTDVKIKNLLKNCPTLPNEMELKKSRQSPYRKIILPLYRDLESLENIFDYEIIDKNGNMVDLSNNENKDTYQRAINSKIIVYWLEDDPDELK